MAGIILVMCLALGYLFGKQAQNNPTDLAQPVSSAVDTSVASEPQPAASVAVTEETPVSTPVVVEAPKPVVKPEPKKEVVKKAPVQEVQGETETDEYVIKEKNFNSAQRNIANQAQSELMNVYSNKVGVPVGRIGAWNLEGVFDNNEILVNTYLTYEGQSKKHCDLGVAIFTKGAKPQYTIIKNGC